MSSVDELTSLIFGTDRDQTSFDTAGDLQAAETLRRWADAGYFTPGFGGAGYDDTVADFAAGTGLFFITGNWIVENLGADSTDFGFFVLPPTDAGAPPVSTGGAGFPLSITSSSEHADAAAAYIDWMNSDHASDLLTQVGQLPLSTSAPASVRPGTVLADVVQAANDVTAANGVVPYLDWATPTFYDTITAGIQELMADRITPQEFVQAAEQDYGDFQRGRP
jgi:raffinose/stachyose/melibiose transport system substrate-binding protein